MTTPSGPGGAGRPGAGTCHRISREAQQHFDALFIAGYLFATTRTGKPTSDQMLMRTARAARKRLLSCLAVEIGDV